MHAIWGAMQWTIAHGLGFTSTDGQFYMDLNVMDTIFLFLENAFL